MEISRYNQQLQTFLQRSPIEVTFPGHIDECCVQLDNGDTDSAVRFPSDSELSEITVSKEEVISYLRKLDVNKSHGPDEIHPRLLKVCCEQIGRSLCALFNHSLNCGRVPTKWKSANITAVHKKKSKKLAENYRPISLLSIVSKTLERCVSNNLYQHVSGHISDEQHGFVRNRSCVTQLLSRSIQSERI